MSADLRKTIAYQEAVQAYNAEIAAAAYHYTIRRAEQEQAFQREMEDYARWWAYHRIRESAYNLSVTWRDAWSMVRGWLR